MTDTTSVGPSSHSRNSTANLSTPSIRLHERFAFQIARTLEKHGVTQHSHIFSDPQLQILELSLALRSLRHVDALLDLASDMTSLCRDSREGAQIVRSSVPHLVSLLPLEGKRYILTHLLQEPSRAVCKSCAYAIIRSCISREELFSLLTPSHIWKLLQLNHKPIDEIVGKVETLRALKNLHIPLSKPLRGTATTAESRKHTQKQIAALRDTALHGKRNLESLPYFTPPHSTVTNSDARRPPPRALTDVYVTIAAIARRADLLLARPDVSRGETESFVASATQRLRVACSDALRLSQSHTLTGKKLWTGKRVDEVLSALAMIPEGHRLMTPTLRVLHMAPMKNLGEWRLSGRVALGVPGVLRHDRKDVFGGASHLVGVTIHEVAHSLQMSGESPYLSWDPSTGIPLSPTNPLFELSTFSNLSKWRVIGRVSPDLIIGKDSVRLDGQLIPLNRPLPLPEGACFSHVKKDFGSEWVIFRYHANDKTLYAHAATASFARSSNASVDPFEDWAETCSDYFLCPTDLISLAPEKFYYMELHFKKYLLTRDLPVLRTMYTALKEAQSHSVDLYPTGITARNLLTDPRQQLFSFVGQKID